MSRVLSLLRYTVGKKMVMAVTGILLFLFVVGHLLGNLKIYLGPEEFNHYAAGLRTLGSPLLAYGQAVWITRLGLLVVLGLHLVTMLQLRAISAAARPVDYHRKESGSFSYASHTMFWGGLALAAFIVYHLLHLTVGTVHPDFQVLPGADGHVHPDAYHNAVSGFQVWWVCAIYAVGQVALGLHLYHGLWSACQTLGVNHPRYNHLRRGVAAAIAWAICLGYLSIPLSVQLGLLK